MTDEPAAPSSDQPAKPAGAEGSGEAQTREQKLAEIRARVEAMKAARAGGAAPPATPVEASNTAPAPAPAGSETAAPEQPPATEGSPPEGSSGELTREQKLAQIRARAEALRAARAGGGAAPAAPAAPAGAPARPAPAKAATAATGIEVPLSSLNPGGRPGVAPVAPALDVYGTINNSVEIRGESSENENLKKLLGGLGAYQNPLRSDAWQVDYRYYAEARRRLEAAGYTVAEKDFLGRPVATWSPSSRGWTRVQS